MLADGKKLAHELALELRDRVATHSHALSLGILVVQETMPIHTFVELKTRFGRDIGVAVEVTRLRPGELTTQHALHTLLDMTKRHAGVIVQLPLPHQVDLDAMLQFLPLSHDVDVMGVTAYQQYREGHLPFSPPVVGAMEHILRAYGVTLAGKHVLVVGEGRLVGAPAAVWTTRAGAIVHTVHAGSDNTADLFAQADIIILGAGSPGLLKPDMVKEGVVILDAGTSEAEGVLKGDADPACAEKALLFTPTPGGVGPLTVAKLFENLLTLDELRSAAERRSL